MPKSVPKWAVDVVHKGKILRRVRLEPSGTYIGRMAENHIALDDARVSRSHAVIRYEGTSWRIEDQESENGIALNGKSLTSSALNLGDEISVGSYVLRVLEDPHALPIDLSAQMRLADNPLREEHTVLLKLAGAAVSDAETRSDQGRPARPVLKFDLEAFGHAHSGEITFDKGKRLAGSAPQATLEVKLTYGEWVMYRKILLES